jgi:hypothetical protein
MRGSFTGCGLDKGGQTMTPLFDFGKDLPLDEAYKFGIEHGLQDEITKIQNMETY